MKIQIIKQYEIGDCCFFIDPKERKLLVDQVNPSSLFGQIIGISNDIYTIKFICMDGSAVAATGLKEEIEWYDLLYDMGPNTISTRFGQDISDNFCTRGMLFKAAMRSERIGNTPFKRGDIVFDLDKRAEEWIDSYAVMNYHKDTFGIIDDIQKDEVGNDMYIVNFGEDFAFSRAPYEIGNIKRFPKKDDPWYGEYTFTKLDNLRLDMFKAGNLDEYIEGYLKEYDKRHAEEKKEDE